MNHEMGYTGIVLGLQHKESDSTGQAVTDNQGLTEKGLKYNHVIINGKELIYHELSYQWTENSALWSALQPPYGFHWITDESHIGYPFEYISHFLQNYQSLTPS